MPANFILRDAAELSAQLQLFEQVLQTYEVKILAQSHNSNGTVLLIVETPVYPHMRALRAAAEDCFGKNLIRIEHSP
jgi:hypothetical protein